MSTGLYAGIRQYADGSWMAFSASAFYGVDAIGPFGNPGMIITHERVDEPIPARSPNGGPVLRPRRVHAATPTAAQWDYVEPARV